MLRFLVMLIVSVSFIDVFILYIIKDKFTKKRPLVIERHEWLEVYLTETYDEHKAFLYLLGG